jgi:16S rRNA (uracil1498-N3)-methyltransferase
MFGVRFHPDAIARGIIDPVTNPVTTTVATPVKIAAARRLHVPSLHPGTIELPEGEAHHARDVLRLADLATVELFDDAGQVARGWLRFDGNRGASVAVEEVRSAAEGLFQLTIAAAVPKGDRADWMIEKLSELGVSRFIPLATQRSVVHPAGTSKRQRWERLAIEAAKQSRRAGVMRIDELSPVESAMDAGWYLSTDPGALPIGDLLRAYQGNQLRLFIGPEGGWTEDEKQAFEAAGLTAVGLTDTILRIETAAVAAAAVVMCSR